MVQSQRRAQLEAAEVRGNQLFDAVEAAGLIMPGKSEQTLSDEIYALARDQFGVVQHWHKRIVRSGANTVATYYDDPPLRMIEPDDTVYLDFGPVLEGFEADLGRSYALGADPDKQRLVGDLPKVFARVQARYHARPEMTGDELYALAQEQAQSEGWIFGGRIAGHTIHGPFPHPPVPREGHLIAPVNHLPMSRPGPDGQERHWILEIHLVDPQRRFGGFYERLL